MNPKPIEPNPIFPLPSDYNEITEEGRRLARINACALWQIGNNREEIARNTCYSLWFFDNYYLWPDESQDYDPQFYPDTPCPPPPGHWSAVDSWATNSTTITVAPRGWAKSFLISKYLTQHLLTRKGYQAVYASSTSDNIRTLAQRIKQCCYENSRIQDDFSSHSDFGGRIQPKRNSAPSALSHFYLTNNATLRSVSVKSALRGIRPNEFFLDDIEFDGSQSTDPAILRDFAERLIFKVAMPTVLHGRSRLHMVGTFISKKHMLWKGANTIQTPNGLRSEDPRFDHWNRIIIRAEARDPQTNTLISCWPDMWPATIAEKEAKGLFSRNSLEEIKQRLSPAVYASEYLQEPGEDAVAALGFDPNPKGRHAHWYEQTDGLEETAPTTSSTLICFSVAKGEIVKMPLKTFLSEYRTIIVVDVAYTEKPTSDRRVCTVLCFGPSNEVFALDMWSDRKPDEELTKQVLIKAIKWNAAVAYVEVVRQSFKYYQTLKDTIISGLARSFIEGLARLNVVPLNPGFMSKQGKISALGPRFIHNKVKFPIWRRYLQAEPWWERLINQTEYFNPAATDGGLEHDDELDTISMCILTPKGAFKGITKEATPIQDSVQLLMNGQKEIAPLVPTVSILPDLSYLTPELLDSIVYPKKESTPNVSPI
jgi:hypothetical protein